MDKILEHFNFPKSVKVKTRIPIKTIVDEMNLPRQDENLLRSQIKALYLVGILDEESTRLRSKTIDEYLYEEIQVFFVHLKTMSKHISLHRKLHSVFPNPTIIITKYEGNYTISTADKRVNLNQEELSVIDNVYLTNTFDFYSQNITDFLKALDYNKYSFKNLYSIFETYQNILYSEQLLELLGEYPKQLLDAKYIKDTLNTISEINTKIKQHEELQKEAIGMNDKMILHKIIKQLKDEKATIITSIKEEL